MKYKISIIVIVSGIISLFLWLFYLSKSRSFQFFWGLINNIHTKENIIALTFDDGPTSGNTEKILNILKKNDIKASFFLIGQDIEKYPEQARKIIQEWHQIGNHSYSHQRMVFNSPQFVRNEIIKTDQLIRDAWYTGFIHFRTPYGKRLFITPYILRSLKKANIFFDVEPETYVTTSWDILNYVIKNTKSWSIILLHPMYGEKNKTLDILEELLLSLKNKWFHFVTIDELLIETNTEISFW